MNLATLHAVFDDKALPFRISRGSVRQEGENRFDLFDSIARNCATVSDAASITANAAKSEVRFAKGKKSSSEPSASP